MAFDLRGDRLTAGRERSRAGCRGLLSAACGWRIGWLACAVMAAWFGTGMLPGLALAQIGAGPAGFDTREEAVRSIPFDELNEQAHAKLWRVVSSPSIYRRLPTQAIVCDPDLYVFLIRYPEVVVNIWQLMGVTKVQVKRTGSFTFDASDGSGTVSSVELVYGRPELHVFYAEGYYEGPLLRQRTYGSSVLVLRSTYNQQAGKPQVTHLMDAFVRLDRPGAEIVVKTLQPVVGKAADFNFIESTKFVGQVQQAAEMNAPGVQRLAAKLTAVGPFVRDQFAQYARAAGQRAVLRENSRAAAGDLRAVRELPTATIAKPTPAFRR